MAPLTSLYLARSESLGPHIVLIPRAWWLSPARNALIRIAQSRILNATNLNFENTPTKLYALINFNLTAFKIAVGAEHFKSPQCIFTLYVNVFSQELLSAHSQAAGDTEFCWTIDEASSVTLVFFFFTRLWLSRANLCLWWVKTFSVYLVLFPVQDPVKNSCYREKME